MRHFLRNSSVFGFFLMMVFGSWLVYGVRDRLFISMVRSEHDARMQRILEEHAAPAPRALPRAGDPVDERAETLEMIRRVVGDEVMHGEPIGATRGASGEAPLRVVPLGASSPQPPPGPDLALIGAVGGGGVVFVIGLAGALLLGRRREPEVPFSDEDVERAMREATGEPEERL